MNVSLAGLPYGNWRELSSKEVETINLLLVSSSKTAEASKDQNKGKGLGRKQTKFNINKRKS